MSIGRTFAESVQKALRSMETGLNGFDEVPLTGAENNDRSEMLGALRQPIPDRILLIAQAFRHGLNLDEIHEASKIDPWFLRQIENIVAAEIGEEGLLKKAGIYD